MRCSFRIVALIALASGPSLPTVSPIFAAEETPPKDWREAASKAGLAKEEVERLAKDKVLVSRQEMLQSFSAYIESELPTFVTSDAVLNAYHVLFEETLRQMEETNEGPLRRFILELWKLLARADHHYTGDDALIIAAQQRSRFVLGVAVKLLGDEIAGAPESLKQAIEEEVAAIEKAEGQRKPALLGPPEPDFNGFDYSLFRPAGFYADSPTLQRYFRAVRWLQLVPFRLDRREELLAWHMTQAVVDHPGTGMPGEEGEQERKQIAEVEKAFFESAQTWKTFGMQATPGALVEGASVPPSSLARRAVDEDFFKQILGPAEFPAVLRREIDMAGQRTWENDRLRLAPGPGAQTGEIRLLSSLRLPEDEGLRRCDVARNAIPFPAGLEFAAWLDCPAAKILLLAGPSRGRMAALEAARPGKEGAKHGWDGVDEKSGVCLAQMHALRGLWEPDARAPGFTRAEPWQRKTLLTVTASWAQHRHAWTLQAKPDVIYQGVTEPPPAFIEPSPEFFRRLGSACRAMSLVAGQAERRMNPAERLANELAALGKTLRSPRDDRGVVEPLTRMANLSVIFKLGLPRFWEAGKGWPEYLRAIETLRRRLTDREPLLLKTIEYSARFLYPSTSDEWERLASTCLKLAQLLDKQLTLKPFLESESQWLHGLGSQLAHHMLYGGNSYLVPRDDAPRVARIVSDPRDRSVMHAGIGRPRLLYVLYPWEGREVLCRGAVMPYHEVTEKKTLTDDEWRLRFQDATRPPVPSWLHDFVPINDVKLDSRKE